MTQTPAATALVANNLPVPSAIGSLDAYIGGTPHDPLLYEQAYAALREAIPNICMQMLLRGQHAVGYSAYPPDVVRAFVAEASASGIDIFRIFDALNNVSAMRAAIEAALPRDAEVLIHVEPETSFHPDDETGGPYRAG